MINRRVLVLNQDFSPLSICSVQRAFLLVYLEKADLVSKSEDMQLHTISRIFPMPAVIKLKVYVRIPYKGVVLTRQNIFKRDNFQCQYCGTSQDLTLDHVIPKARGGKSTWSNLVTACKPCNTRKGDFMPEEIGFTIRNLPYRPSYIIFLRDYSGYTHREWEPYLKTGTSDW
jgi:5-methylcytosine-specific restriction endonuclease McrA